MTDQPIAACAACFRDEGLRLMADRLGKTSAVPCSRCGNTAAGKLDPHALYELARQFFVYGASFKTHYGGANAIQFNEYHYGKDDIEVPAWLKKDMLVLGEILKVGFFHYGPRLWRLGHIEPLEKLQTPEERPQVIEEILAKFPAAHLLEGACFYRLRKNPDNPVAPEEYDSPPEEFCGSGRLDARTLPVLYGSTEIETCIHECRVTLEDELYMAKLRCNMPLRLLDLTAEIDEEPDEFTSLRMSVLFLFDAAAHSYEIIREISAAAHARGFDDILYHSYFSSMHAREQKAVNIALFGRPVAANKVTLECANRLMLEQVKYTYGFGPGAF